MSPVHPDTNRTFCQAASHASASPRCEKTKTQTNTKSKYQTSQGTFTAGTPLRKRWIVACSGLTNDIIVWYSLLYVCQFGTL